MGKNNIRSFRYSDRVAEILEGFTGDSMNAKFENLVLYCFDRLPALEEREKDLLGNISKLVSKVSSINMFVRDVDNFKRDFDRVCRSAELLAGKYCNTD